MELLVKMGYVLAGQGAKKVFSLPPLALPEKRWTAPNETKIVLIDGQQLTQYRIYYNLGVTSYEVKRMDSDYFGED